jgi:probable HAF family extracellular repeat protein
VVVGRTVNAAWQLRAFRWTAAGGMQDLGMLGGIENEARDVSADGSVVVGVSSGRAFRWTQVTGMQDLGTLSGYGSKALGVSADGSVVVGAARNAAGQLRAFRWTPDGGMEDLNQTYASLQMDGSALWWAALTPLDKGGEEGFEADAFTNFGSAIDIRYLRLLNRTYLCHSSQLFFTCAFRKLAPYSLWNQNFRVNLLKRFE